MVVVDGVNVSERPEGFNFTRDVVERLARDRRRRAFTFVDGVGVIQQFTFDQLAADAARWARLLRERGHEPGDRVLVVLGKVPAWIGVMLGAIKGGLVAVPCPETSDDTDLATRAWHSGASALIADRSAEPEIDAMRAGLDAEIDVVYLDQATPLLAKLPSEAPTEVRLPHDPAFVLHTAGTTADPKAVTHTHAYTDAARIQAGHWLDARPGDVVWCTAGTARVLAIWNLLLGPWSRGAEIVMHGAEFNPAERVDLLGVLGVTILSQSPAEYQRMSELEQTDGLGPLLLRHAVSTGEPLDPAVIAGFRERFGLTIHDGYGQTENAVLLASTSDRPAPPGSVGWPTPGHHVAIIDADGMEVEAGVEGDIALHGRPASLFLGYWEAPEATSAAFRGEWYLTGDKGVRDGDGSIRFTRRADADVRGAPTNGTRPAIIVARPQPADVTSAPDAAGPADDSIDVATTPHVAAPADIPAEPVAAPAEIVDAVAAAPALSRRERREAAKEAKRAERAHVRAEADARRRHEEAALRAAKEAEEAERAARLAAQEARDTEAARLFEDAAERERAHLEQARAEEDAARAESERVRTAADNRRKAEKEERKNARRRDRTEAEFGRMLDTARRRTAKQAQRQAEEEAERAERDRRHAEAEAGRQEVAERRAAEEARQAIQARLEAEARDRKWRKRPATAPTTRRTEIEREPAHRPPRAQAPPRAPSPKGHAGTGAESGESEGIFVERLQYYGRRHPPDEPGR